MYSAVIIYEINEYNLLIAGHALPEKLFLISYFCHDLNSLNMMDFGYIILYNCK